MAISRFWRLVGIATPGNGPLELSEARLYQGGALADASATLTATIAPVSGALADLRDGLATGVVSWPYASYSAAGFALVWDFGAGGGVDAPGLRLGSGGSTATFPADLTAQRSVDGINWTFFDGSVNVSFPGAQALTSVPAAGASSANYNAVVVQLAGEGVNGSTTILDSSPAPKSVTVVGDTRISTAQSPFSGGGSLAFDGSGDALTLASDTAFDLGDTYRIEFWIRPTSVAVNQGIVHRGFYSTTGNWTELAFSLRLIGGPLRCYYYATTNSNEQYIDAAGIFANVWTYGAMVRNGTSGAVYINGALAGTISGLNTPAASTRPLKVGLWDYSAGAEYFNGCLLLRITKGVGGNAVDFAVPTIPFETSSIIQVGRSAARTRQTAPTPERLFPAADLPTTTAHGHLREFPFFDVFNGGIGLITGTVKEKSLPANVPLARKVWLMDEASGMVVRETWSDATTGAYEFRGVKQGVKYTVLAYDYTGAYRAVVADRIIPETTV